MNKVTQDASVPPEFEPGKYVDLIRPRSFLLSAGAGSGKTRAVVDTVRTALSTNLELLRVSGAQIAVITYTRKARDELTRRLGNNPKVSVSTVHSFAWSVISPHTLAIKRVLGVHLESSLAETRHAQSKGRPGAATDERARKIDRDQKRLDRLPHVDTFAYSPDRDLPSRGELSHSDVLLVFETLLASSPLLGQILVSKFPVLLIDEAQDTSKTVLPSLIKLSIEHSSAFCLGLFGDMMQRVYFDGVAHLQDSVPATWSFPKLSRNYRSTTRIVDLANALRASAGLDVQVPNTAAPGTIRAFFASVDADRMETESRVRQEMAECAGDREWSSTDQTWNDDQTKLLVLEHSLAAHRAGFSAFFSCFPPKVKGELTGQGASLGPTVAYLTKLKELIDALQLQNLGTASRILTELRDSQSIDAVIHKAQVSNEQSSASRVRDAAFRLADMARAEESCSTLEILDHVKQSGLFSLPPGIAAIVEHEHTSDSTSDPVDPSVSAWRAAMETPWTEASACLDYVQGNLSIDTQQGVKGLEFDRVMVVLDDSQAGGNWFNFDRLIGLAEPSATDLKNLQDGKETASERTRRLFYVACTRAKNSLAVIHYSRDPSTARDRMVQTGWFFESETEVI